MTTLDQQCVECCVGDRVAGYAIFFSGDWDAYLSDGRNLILIGRAFDRDGAIHAVNEGRDWRKQDGDERKINGFPQV